jgi:L-fuconate dehydratase
MPRIRRLTARDIRFPTSQGLHGSDAMNPDPDYSCVYVTLETDDAALAGNGITFTIGRGNEVCLSAVEALRPLVVGQSLADIARDSARFWRSLVGDSQLRWIGPDKGAIHLACAAVANAVWDLWAKRVSKPVWQLVADMTPDEVMTCLDLKYLADVLTPDEALTMLQAQQRGRSDRLADLKDQGYPAYTTSAGWLGYPDDMLRSLCREMLAEGWGMFKIKVGRDLEDDLRRCRILREEIGEGRKLMVDANQVWDVPTAIDWIGRLAQFDPWFVEEPTHPDDVLGHAAIAKAVAPLRIATGEHCANRIMVKQLLQSGGMQVCQLDSCRLAGINEILAVMLMAAKFGIPVCPHAGGVGLCEYVNHLAMIDYLVVSGKMENRVAEYSAHLHEHFVHPVVMKNGRYTLPTAPGYSIDMLAESLDEYEFNSRSRLPDGT